MRKEKEREGVIAIEFTGSNYPDSCPDIVFEKLLQFELPPLRWWNTEQQMGIKRNEPLQDRYQVLYALNSCCTTVDCLPACLTEWLNTESNPNGVPVSSTR